MSSGLFEGVAAMTAQQSEVTRLLQAAHDGEKDALEALVPRLYDDLRQLAGVCLRRERPGHTLQPTALVHEAWLKLLQQDSLGFAHRREFFSAAATTMRRILVDHARRPERARRDGRPPAPFDATVDALDVLMQYGNLSAQSVASALYNDLQSQLPPGVVMMLVGSNIEFDFAPGSTQVEGGIHFGTTSTDPMGELSGTVSY